MKKSDYIHVRMLHVRMNMLYYMYKVLHRLANAIFRRYMKLSKGFDNLYDKNI